MIDWVQLGRIVVLPVDEPSELQLPLAEDYQPLMLLVLNSTDAVEWEELQTKVYTLACSVRFILPLTPLLAGKGPCEPDCEAAEQVPPTSGCAAPTAADAERGYVSCSCTVNSRDRTPQDVLYYQPIEQTRIIIYQRE